MVQRRPSVDLVAALAAVASCIGISEDPSLLNKETVATNSVPSGAARARIAEASLRRSFAQLPLSFEPNQGQTDREVKFLSRGRRYTLFLTGEEAVLALQPDAPSERGRSSGSELGRPSVLRMRLLGSNPAPEIAALEKLPGKSNYFVGS